jgi:predicted deacylase
LPVTTGLNGAPLELTALVAAGEPTETVLTLVSTIHGGEWFSIEPLRQTFANLDVTALRGTVIFVPVANPPAFGRRSRNMPNQQDSPDMNRIFPGPLTATSDQLANVLANEILSVSTCLLDFHMGPWGSAFRDILIGSDYVNGASEQALELALAFGTPTVRSGPVVAGFPGPRSSLGYAGGVLGIPALGVEIGGPGFGKSLEDAWIEETVAGIGSIMHELDMIDESPLNPPARQLVYRDSARVNPKNGGFLRSNYSGDRLSSEVERGTHLGTIISPYTGDTLERLIAPFDGVLYYVARDQPLDPGEWAFGLADANPDTSRWVATGTGI